MSLRGNWETAVSELDCWGLVREGEGKGEEGEEEGLPGVLAFALPLLPPAL